MQTDCFTEIRQACLLVCYGQPDVRSKLGLKHISLTGGTVFLSPLLPKRW